MSLSTQSRHFLLWVNRVAHLRFSNNTQLLFLSVGIGVLTALGVALYHVLIDLAHHLFRGWLSPDTTGAILGVLMLALAGFIVGVLRDRFVGHEKHHGVAGIVESVALSGGRLPYWKMPAKALISGISLGAGASIGPEDPSVQIGSNIGSLVGLRLRLSEDNIRMLVAAGAASAVAAAFNAPIAGVFFALEIILNGVFTTGSFGVIVLAAVISAATTQAIEPINPESIGPLTYTLGSPLEILLYVPLGIVLAPFAAGFIKLIYWQHDLWHNFLPRPLRTALAGALVGIVGIFLPQILGIGRETMNGVLSGELNFVLPMLFVLALAKMLTTAVSLGGGFIGGVFAPSLYAGTMLGAAYGYALGFMGVSPQAFAIAGMAGMLAGVLRAPITAIMIVFELTGDYRLILPVMLTTVICTYFAERWQKEGIYAFGLARTGIRLRQGRDVDVMQGVQVREAMHTPAATIAEGASLTELREGFRAAGMRSLCVVDEEGLLSGIVTLSDLQKAYDSTHDADQHLTVGDICKRDVMTAEPDEPLWAALRRMGAQEIGRLPVVEAGTRKILGIVRRHNIVRAYNMAITQRLEDQHHEEQIRLNTLTGAHVFELHIATDAPIVGKHISEIPFPDESVIAAVRREGKLIVPHGKTTLYAGDRLAIVAAPEVEAELRKLTGTI